MIEAGDGRVGLLSVPAAWAHSFDRLPRCDRGVRGARTGLGFGLRDGTAEQQVEVCRGKHFIRSSADLYARPGSGAGGARRAGHAD